MGNANTTLTDEWSVLNNVGGISAIGSGSVFFGYQRYFDIEGFDRVGAGIIQPMKFGNIGFSALRFGDNLLSEQVFSAAFGNKIGFVRLGIRGSYYQMRIDEFGTASAFMLDVGGIVEMIPNLTFGAYISNITAARLNNEEKSRLPVLMKIGISYKPTTSITLNLDIHKEVVHDPILKIGMEYRFIEKLYMRTGINANPFKAFFGVGFEWDRFSLDYTIVSHEFLGLSHQASVVFRYQKK